MPKRIHFKYSGMHMRSIIAILDHNSNVSKTMIEYKMAYSKPLGRVIQLIIDIHLQPMIGVQK